MGHHASWDLLEKRLSRLASPGIHPGLARLSRLLALLGHPERIVPTVHVVGTNGKGSTCAFLESVLRAGGYRTALYTSPHLESPGERLRLNGQELSPDAWLEVLEPVERMMALDRRLGESPPTYFELVTALAFGLMREYRPDVAVLEAGMGGRLDATNMASAVRLSVITPIDRDHEEFLGTTLESIAGEKFAVIRPQGKALFAGGTPTLHALFQDRCRRLGTEGSILTEAWTLQEEQLSLHGGRFSQTGPFGSRQNLEIALLGEHQLRNAALAVAGIDMLREEFPVSDDALRTGLLAARWPGRCELVLGSPSILWDGAHNPHGMAALAGTLHRLWGDEFPMTVVFAAMKDKNYTQGLEFLQSRRATLICTRVPGNDRSAVPELLAREALRVGWENVVVESDPRQALEQARCRGHLVVVCGSLYLLGFLRGALAASQGVA